MSIQIQNQNVKKYDLQQRTALFGERIIGLVEKIEVNVITKSLISQVIRSSCSIGANYMEADAAESRKDFKHKIALCKKESKETMHWLRMLSKAAPYFKNEIKLLYKEVHELVLIFSSIILSMKKKKEN